MRLNWMSGGLLAAAIASPSSTQISVHIGTPPPAIVYEEAGPPPGAGFVWLEGYWTPVGHHYKWVWGRWGVLPLKGHTGRIHITTTIAKAGKCTKDIGTARTMTRAIGTSMIVDEDMGIATIAGTNTTTSRSHHPFAQSREPPSLGANSWTSLAGPTSIAPSPSHDSLL